MASDTPNLLVRLFAWRPREGTTSGENFLTESFVHALSVNPALRKRWLSDLLSHPVDEESVLINTRASHRDDESGNTIFPDVEIIGCLESEQPFRLFVEVKWDAPYSRRQITAYSRLLGNDPHSYLAFICARGNDYRQAIADSPLFTNVTFKAQLWEQVFSTIVSTPGNCPFSKELVGFMVDRNLNPGQAISKSMADAFLTGKPIIERFHRYLNKMLHEYSWDFLPPSHRNITDVKPGNRYGRVALEFGPSVNGRISIGFLYDNKDHNVPFADGSSSSLDLVMRIECLPNAAHRQPLLEAIKARAADVRLCGGVVR